MSNEQELKISKAKRAQIKGQVTRFSTFLNGINNDNLKNSISQLKTRLEKFKTTWDEYDLVQSKIESLTLEDQEQQQIECNDRCNFENSYFAAASLAQDLIDQASISNTVNDISVGADNRDISNINADLVKLPPINLPEFSGSYDKWSQFIECFTSLVDQRSSLSQIQKFFYLRSCLKGEAAQTIQAVPMSEANYAVAWELLKSRYENKRVIINSHIKAIMDFQPLNKETFQGLRKLLDCIQKNVRSLTALGQPTESWDALLIYIVVSYLDPITKREWEMSIKENTLPTYDALIKFITNKCYILETMNYNDKANTRQRKPDHLVSFLSTSEDKNSNKTYQRTCTYCKGSHSLYQCNEFLKLSVEQRIKQVEKMKLCKNCLRGYHPIKQCRFSGCKQCNRFHNTILHIVGNPVAETEGAPLASTCQSLSAGSAQQSDVCLHSSLPTTCSSNDTNNSQKYIMLSTAIIKLTDADGKQIRARALLDSASQSNFITKELFEQLKLQGCPINTPVVGISGTPLKISRKVKVTVSSCFDSKFKADLSFLVLNEITQRIPSINMNKNDFIVPKDIELADKHFYKPSKIDLLLGAEIFYDLLSVGQIRISRHQPIFQNSKLGWFVCGNVSLPSSINNQLCYLTINSNSEDNDLRSNIEKFWQIEECNKGLTFSKEEHECEQHFRDNTTRNSDGRFVVKLPLKMNSNVLGNSLENAIRRLYSLERKFNKDADLKSEYDNFIREYESLGHMSRIHDDEIHSPNNKANYLPHHAVFKESSLTSRIRVVFDASFKTSSGVSLNDICKVGPTIQHDLFSILIRFRKHPCVLTADIAKMYRQVLISPEQRDLQRIVYRWNSSDDMTHFRLNTVTYGTAPASFLSIRCLHQIAIDIAKEYPSESKIILEDFYVDDLLTGCENVSDAIKLKTNLTRILHNYGFELRKWFSNKGEILNQDTENAELPFFHISDNKCVKTLGLLWDANKDELIYAVNLNPTIQKATKRLILSTISQIFDPLGLLGPIIVTAKLIIQKLWQLRVNWDEPIPTQLQVQWDEFKQGLAYLNQIRIPRFAFSEDMAEIQIHGFCDASERAYGAAVYLRCSNNLGQHHTTLLCAKSKVAPLKTISLPKLELCGAVLLTSLVDKVKSSIDFEFSRVYYWCDSTIVLAWISQESSAWKVFVANRVGEIRRSTESFQWSHVSSADNPADIISRGLAPRSLAESDLWWKGPAWLSRDATSWPQNSNLNINTDEERKLTFISTIAYDQCIFTRYSSLFKLQRVIAYCLRFMYNASNKTNKITGSLKIEEMNNAMHKLIFICQGVEFAEEIDALKKSKPLHKTSKILTLNPFLDEKSILRVGGRIRRAQISYDQKFPILLPKSHALTKLIIRDTHYNNMHAGMQATLAAVRLKFWPICGKQTVRNMLRKCVICFRAKPNNFIPMMGDLPESRVSINRPFYNSGVDLAGPFLIRDGKTRNRRLVKAYIAIFVCFSTRASHLEVVSDLSSDAFLNALKRFVSRRGICKNLYSDNATNFTGSNNELKCAYKFIAETIEERDSNIKEYLLKNSISWHFIPASSPHFGGLWEAAVKSVKFHLKRVANNIHFTFEEFSTLCAQIEALLNSRPLVPLSDDPSDMSILTPGHFLIGDSMAAIPEQDVTELNMNRLSKYQKIQQVFQQLWRRWQREVLSQMQQRNKWLTQRQGIQPFQIGTLVLLMEKNTPPLQWPLGRIVGTYSGDDGIIRVLDIQTRNSLVQRAVHKVCVLPTGDMLEGATSKGGGMFEVEEETSAGTSAVGDLHKKQLRRDRGHSFVGRVPS